MAIIEWNESYSVNIPSLDEQHKKLFLILNKTQEMIQSGKSEKELKEIFEEILSYASEHFSYEEKLISENEFEGFAEHKLEHDKFNDSIIKYLTRFESKDSIHPVEILGFLLDWLQSHLLKKDKEFVSLLVSRGVI
jgi:hemerythrin-like metal-binding protein